ncbi:MAG: hypothetical protein Q8W44_00825 [Candidatus Palauibacterales bacterium]|nr:hypothetical protein [Candidatus Palauibacterales bacterium]
MHIRRVSAILAAAAAALLFAVPKPMFAQQPGTIDLTAGAGVGLPTGSLADISDLGPAFLFAADYGVSPGLAIRGGVGAEVFESVTATGGEGPTVRLFRLTVGPSVTLVSSAGETGLRLRARGGIGGTAFTAGRTLVGTGSNVRAIDFTEVYLALDGGVDAVYAFSRSVGAYLSAGASMSFAAEEDMEVFTFLDPDVEPFSSLVSVPITAGVRLTFPR